MRYAVGLVLLLLCATAAAGADAPATVQPTLVDGPTVVAGDIAVLTLDEDARTGFARSSIDVSTAVGTQGAEARSRLTREALRVAFERAGEEQARRELLFEAATVVEIKISELRTERRALRASYRSGEVSTDAFLRQQVLLDARAEQLRLDLQGIRELSDRVPRLSMDSRVASLLASLTGFEGPVTARVESAIAGEAAPVRLYVATSTNGTTLSMIDENEYVRQSFRSDLWNPDSSSGLPLDDVEALAGEIYPAAFNPPLVSSRGIANVGTERAVDTGIYRITIVHQQGEIEAYLDGGTERVFYEVQRRPLDQIDPGPSVTATDNGTRLTVNRTFQGGPLRVYVVDNRTSEPASVDVLVGDERLATGSDGVAWTLMPAETTSVTAVTAGGNVSVVASPVPPSVGNATASVDSYELVDAPAARDRDVERAEP